MFFFWHESAKILQYSDQVVEAAFIYKHALIHLATILVEWQQLKQTHASQMGSQDTKNILTLHLCLTSGVPLHTIHTFPKS